MIKRGAWAADEALQCIPCWQIICAQRCFKWQVEHICLWQKPKHFFLKLLEHWTIRKPYGWELHQFLRSESDSCQRQIASATYDLRVAYSIKMGRWRLWAGFSDFDNFDRFHWCWSLCSWQKLAKKLNLGAKIQTVNKHLKLYTFSWICKQTTEIVNKQLKL